MSKLSLHHANKGVLKNTMEKIILNLYFCLNNYSNSNINETVENSFFLASTFMEIQIFNILWHEITKLLGFSFSWTSTLLTITYTFNIIVNTLLGNFVHWHVEMLHLHEIKMPFVNGLCQKLTWRKGGPV